MSEYHLIVSPPPKDGDYSEQKRDSRGFHNRNISSGQYDSDNARTIEEYQSQFMRQNYGKHQHNSNQPHDSNAVSPYLKPQDENDYPKSVQVEPEDKRNLEMIMQEANAIHSKLQTTGSNYSKSPAHGVQHSLSGEGRIHLQQQQPSAGNAFSDVKNRLQQIQKNKMDLEQKLKQYEDQLKSHFTTRSGK